MRYLILSDLHANLEAATAAIRDAEKTGWDAVLCLGDLVGYGGDPNGVIDLVRALRPAAIVRGNHDKVVAGLEEGEMFSDVAREAAHWTRSVLRSDNRDWLAALPRGPLAVGSFHIAHGTPVDEDDYILNDLDAAGVFEGASFDTCFVGHSHFACVFSAKGETMRLEMLQGDTRELRLEAGVRSLVNPGSIGQPRDHDPRAAYGVYDDAAGVVTVRRVAYDVASAQRRIRQAGLPDPLAMRLEFGL